MNSEAHRNSIPCLIGRMVFPQQKKDFLETMIGHPGGASQRINRTLSCLDIYCSGNSFTITVCFCYVSSETCPPDSSGGKTLLVLKATWLGPSWFRFCLITYSNVWLRESMNTEGRKASKRQESWVVLQRFTASWKTHDTLIWQEIPNSTNISVISPQKSTAFKTMENKTSYNDGTIIVWGWLSTLVFVVCL